MLDASLGGKIMGRLAAFTICFPPTRASIALHNNIANRASENDHRPHRSLAAGEIVVSVFDSLVLGVDVRLLGNTK